MALTQFIRPRKPDEIMGWSATTRKRKIESGELKPPIRLSPMTVGWPAEYIEQYQKQLLSGREDLLAS